jgi:hypothetical protein
MGENILSHAIFSARCVAFSEAKNLWANLVPLILTAFQQISEKECGKPPRQLTNVAEPACSDALHRFRCDDSICRKFFPGECLKDPIKAFQGAIQCANGLRYARDRQFQIQ